jgi:hypothetical protein
MEKEHVLAELQVHKFSSRDQTVNQCNTRFNILDGDFELVNWPDDAIGPERVTKLNLTSLAEGQLLSRLKIPVAYFHRCPNVIKGLNYNYWTTHTNQQLVLRQVGDFTRAIVSRRYNTAYDDVHVIPQLLETLLEDPAGYILSFYKDLEFTRLFVAFRDTRVEREGVLGEAGVVFTNSEVGISCLHVRPYILWDRQYNPYDTVSGKSFYHSSQFDLQEVLRAGLAQKEVAQAGLVQLLIRGTQRVRNPFKQIEKLAEKNVNVFPTRVMLMLKSEWEEQRNIPLLAVVRSILDAVKELPIFQKHLASEVVGRYLDLFSHTEARVKAMLWEDVDEIPVEQVIDQEIQGE